MNVLISGGSGFIGQKLTDLLSKDQHHVHILSRSQRKSKNPYVTYLKWNGKEMPLGIGLYDVVVNLAGVGIADQRWTEAYKFKIRESRIDPTRACVTYINTVQRPPKVFISASAVGYYGGENDQRTNESASAGDDFLAEISKEWESIALEANCRTVLARFGVVLGNEGGAFPLMETAYNFFLGGRLGSGEQGFSWVHIDDVVHAMRFAIDHASIAGPINVTSPNIVSQKVFSRELGKALNRPDPFWVPKFVLDMMLGSRSILLLGGQWAVPEKLRKHGYSFKFPELGEALKDLTSE